MWEGGMKTSVCADIWESQRKTKGMSKKRITPKREKKVLGDQSIQEPACKAFLPSTDRSDKKQGIDQSAPLSTQCKTGISEADFENN